MKKVKLTLFEVHELSAELSGIVNQTTGERLQKGLLNEKLKISVKYNLTTLADALISELEKVNKFKEELIKSLGDTDDNGAVTLPIRINEKVNTDTNEVESWDISPKYLEYSAELNELLSQEIEIEFNEVAIDDLNIETEVNPRILFKIINQK